MAELSVGEKALLRARCEGEQTVEGYFAELAAFPERLLTGDEISEEEYRILLAKAELKVGISSNKPEEVSPEFRRLSRASNIMDLIMSDFVLIKESEEPDDVSFAGLLIARVVAKHMMGQCLYPRIGYDLAAAAERTVKWWQKYGRHDLGMSRV